MTRCSVLGCVNRRDRLKPYFRFPSKKDPFQCLKWVVFCQREDVKKGFFKSPDYIRNHTVCSEHFTPCCFTNRDCKRLVHDAVPSLFRINPQRVKLYPHHPMTGLDIDTPPNAAQYPVDKAVLEEMFVQQSEELKAFLKTTWRQNHYKLDTLAEIPHVHGDDRIPIHKHSLFPENASSSPIQIIITADDAADPKPPPSHPTCQRVPSQHPQALLQQEQPTTQSLPPAKDNKQRKRVSRAQQITSAANGKRKRTAYKKRRRKTPVESNDGHELKEEPVRGGVCSYYVCCVLGCTSTNKTCMLYPFPSSPQQAQTWLDKSSRQDLESFLRLNGAVPNNFLLCRRHFHDDQFGRKGDQEVLKVHAVPSFFPGVEAALRQSNRRRPGPRQARRPVNYNEDEVVIVVADAPKETDSTARPTESTCLVRLQRLVSSFVTLEFCADHGLGLSPGRRCKDLLLAWESRWPQHASVGRASVKGEGPPLTTTPRPSISSKFIVRCSTPCSHKTCKLVSKPTASVSSPQCVQDFDAAKSGCPRRSQMKRRAKKQWHTPQVEGGSWSDPDQLHDCSDSDGSGYESLCHDCGPRAKLLKTNGEVIIPTSRATNSAPNEINPSSNDINPGHNAVNLLANGLDPSPCAANPSPNSTKLSCNATTKQDDVKETVDSARTVTEEEKQLVDDLDTELERLKHEYRVLYDATAFRKRKLKDAVAKETTAEAVYSHLSPFLSEGAYEFLARQLTHIPYVTWCVESTRVPILMTMCGVRLYPVFSELFKLPSVSTLHLYKGKARRDPSLYGKYMNDFVQKQYRSRHHPATRRHFGRRGTQKSVPVAEQIISYLEKKL